MRFLRQSLTGLFLLAVTVALLFYAVALVRGAVQDRLADEGRSRPAQERVFAVAVVEAQPETVIPRLEAFGQIESRRSLVLRAAAAGTVIELSDAMKEGGEVRAGDILLRIDPADAQSALDRAEANLLDSQAETRDAARSLELAHADLAAADAQADLRQRAFARQQGLQERGVATEAAVEVAELAAASARQAVVARRQSLAQAEARVDRAATALSRAEIAREEASRRLADTVVRAEFDGTLSDVSVVAGGLVGSNEQLARLVDGRMLEVAFRVSTAQHARLLDQDGELIPATVTVSLDTSGIDLSTSGQISRDSAAVAEGQSGRLIFASLAAPRGMKPGDFVTVSVEEPALDRVVRLPARSLGSDGRVLALGDEGRIEALPVTLLRRQGDDVLVRGQGLRGRQIVTQRTPLLGPGIKVRALGAADESAEPEMIALSDERRARLLAFVDANKRMPADVKERMRQTLQQDAVPSDVVSRLEARLARTGG